MKTPKLSIFVRILLATLLPLVFVFSIVVITTNRIIYQANVNFARERTTLINKQVATQAETTFRSLDDLLQITASNLVTTLDDKPIDVNNPTDFLHNLMQTNPNIYCAWLVLESGVAGNEQRTGYSFLRDNDGRISEVRKINRTILEDPSRSPWYNVPRRSRQPFFYTLDTYDYGTGEGSQYNGGFGYPLIYNGKIAGVIGLDILYSDTFSFLKTWEDNTQQRVMLLAGNGIVLYSSNPSIINRNIEEVGFKTDTVDILRTAMRENQSHMFEGVSANMKTGALLYLSPLKLFNSDRSMFLLTEVPIADLYREAERALELIVSTSIIGLILLGASVFFATRNIVKPIKKLTSNAEWIANGKLDVVLDDFTGDHEPRHEVDQLEMSMKKMLNELSLTHELRLKAMEAEHEKEKLEQSSEAQARFFANMSHEIRTPMNAILGMAELLLNEPLEKREAKYARDIKLASESLLGIINDILDLSKLESGKLQLVSVHYDLRSLMDNIYSLCFFLAKNKGLDFSMTFADDVPQCLYGDDVRLRQILLNIIGNAIKFTRRGGVRVGVVNEGATLRINVNDTGIGIKPEDIEFLFEPFKQFDKEKNHNINGTGLGLSISHNLVDLMGGEIEMESEYGAGSDFRVRIPNTPGNPDKVESRTEMLQARFTDDSRVLVVDDSPINLDVAVGLIGLFGIKCDTATLGREALEKLAISPYDIVFMDHMMPEMDGVETTQEIRKMPGREKQIIIALTANAVIGTKEMFIESGMDDFLSKPIVKTKLQAMLSKWMPKNKRAGVTSSETYRRNTIIRINPSFGSNGFEDSPGERAESDMAMTKILHRARDIPGLDVNQGLDQVAMDEDLYLSVLSMLAEMRESVPAKLQAALDDGDDKAFRIEIHAVKGALANLGAMMLAEHAAKLEQAAKEADMAACRKGTPAFLARFDELTSRVSDLFTQKSPSGDDAGGDNNGDDTPPPPAAPMAGARLRRMDSTSFRVASIPGRKPAGDHDKLRATFIELRSALGEGDKSRCLALLTELSSRDLGEDDNANLEEVVAFVEWDNFDDAGNFLDAKFSGKFKEN